MSIGSEADLGLPTVTMAADPTKRTIPMGGRDAYQSLPRFLPPMLKPLVRLDWSTNAYHSPDLGRILPSIAFTNLYHRGEGLTIEPGISDMVAGWWWWTTVIAVDNVENRRNHPEWWHGGGRCRKDFQKKYFLVGMPFKPHGGKTGRAMIKYPPYKKNAQGLKRALYPGLTIVSLDRIINL